MSSQILVVIAAVFGIVIYRVITVSTFAAFGWALIRNNSQVATTGTAVCINFCIIMLLNVVSVCQHHRVLKGWSRKELQVQMIRTHRSHDTTAINFIWSE